MWMGGHQSFRLLMRVDTITSWDTRGDVPGQAHVERPLMGG